MSSIEEHDITDQVQSNPSWSSPVSSFTMPRRSYNKAYRRYTQHNSMHNDKPVSTMIMEELPMPQTDTTISRAYSIASYAHAMLILVLTLSTCTLVMLFSTGVLGDIFRKTRQRAEAIIVHATECSVNKINSGCHVYENGTVGHDIPAMSVMCHKWHACEKRSQSAWLDALSASVCAETAAEIINAFTERISSSSVLVGVLAVVIIVSLSSCAFGVMHRKVTNHPVCLPEPPRPNFSNPHMLPPSSTSSRLAIKSS